MGHLYHGYVSHNQRVNGSVVCWKDNLEISINDGCPISTFDHQRVNAPNLAMAMIGHGPWFPSAGYGAMPVMNAMGYVHVLYISIYTYIDDIQHACSAYIYILMTYNTIIGIILCVYIYV
jgi:hypothetical protein